MLKAMRDLENRMVTGPWDIVSVEEEVCSQETL